MSEPIPTAYERAMERVAHIEPAKPWKPWEPSPPPKTFEEFLSSIAYDSQYEYSGSISLGQDAWNAAVEACAKLAHDEGQLIKDANDPAWIVARDIERFIRALKVSE